MTTIYSSRRINAAHLVIELTFDLSILRGANQREQASQMNHEYSIT